MTKHRFKICVELVNPPIPFRGHDWLACIDGQEENQKLYGRGATREEAVNKLMELLDEPETPFVHYAKFRDGQSGTDAYMTHERATIQHAGAITHPACVESKITTDGGKTILASWRDVPPVPRIDEPLAGKRGA